MNNLALELSESVQAETRYLSFNLDKQCYGIDILRIKEIIEYEDFSPIPMMPDFIRGAIQLRGKTVPVIDLSKRLGMDHAVINSRSCILMMDLEWGGHYFECGVLVDKVNEVVDTEHHHFDELPGFDESKQPEFIDAMGQVNGKFIILLNIGSLFSSVAINGDELSKLNSLVKGG